jgi:ribosome-associated protein
MYGLFLIHSSSNDESPVSASQPESENHLDPPQPDAAATSSAQAEDSAPAAGSQADLNPAGEKLMIRLDDLLKRLGWVESGGQAKMFIQDGQVSVNGQTETRRRKQLFVGDVIECLGQEFELESSFFDCY